MAQDINTKIHIQVKQKLKFLKMVPKIEFVAILTDFSKVTRSKSSYF